MPKVSVSTIVTSYASIDVLNANFAALVAALDNTLSRDGTSPNAMNAPLDMNNKSIINLPDGVGSTEPATVRQLQAAQGLAAAFPSQVGNANKVLKTDGIVVGWQTVATLLAVDPAGNRTALDVPSNAQAVLKSLIAAKGDLVVGTADDTPAVKSVGTSGKALVADSTSSDGLAWVALALGPGGRVSISTGTPVPTSDVTAATTVYYTPYKHNFVQLYDGMGWANHTFSEMSQATSDATKSPAAVANNSNYDVFVWNDAGTLRATRGPAWTSDTARGTGAGTTELTRVDGRWVNAVSITNGPAAQRGLYVGTIRSNGSAQINDSLALRHVWNTYNRVARPMQVIEATNTWTYSTAAFRQANGATTNQLDMVRGLNEDAVVARVQAFASNSTATERGVAVGIGLDSTTVFSGVSGFISVAGNAKAISGAAYTGLPGLGRHFLAWLERGDGTDVQTWYGDNGGAMLQSGIQGSAPA